MSKVFAYLKKNYIWIFSGIGVAAITGVIAIAKPLLMSDGRNDNNDTAYNNLDIELEQNNIISENDGLVVGTINGDVYYRNTKETKDQEDIIVSDRSDKQQNATANHVDKIGDEQRFDLDEENHLSINTEWEFTTGGMYFDEYYGFSLNHKGYLYVSWMNCDEAYYETEADQRCIIRIYDEDTQRPLTEKLFYRSDVQQYSDILRLPSGLYYLEIDDNFSDKFQLCIVFEEEYADHESEWNNDSYTATEVKLGTEMYGNIGNENDVDYFIFNVDEPKPYTLKFWNSETGVDDIVWQLSIINESGTEVFWDKFPKNETESMIGELLAGNYFLRISCKTYSNAPYGFSIY